MPAVGQAVPMSLPPMSVQQGPDVSPAEAHRAAEAGEVLLVDVREDHEWAAGHAPSAVHVPLGRLTADSLPRDRPVVAVCRVGGRSGAAAEALAGIGYDVRNTAGGMLAWEAAGLPVVVAGGAPGTVV